MTLLHGAQNVPERGMETERGTQSLETRVNQMDF